MDYKIGDIVIARGKDKMPEQFQSNSHSRFCGKAAEIVDIIFSERERQAYYILHFEGCVSPSSTKFTDECFDLDEFMNKFSFDFDICGNVVVAMLMEQRGDRKIEVARGHGHVIHDGIKGYAQAASYACKKVWENLNGGTL